MADVHCLVNSYSITPVQIVQEHKLVSDLRPGTGGGWWDDDLTDSALQRAQLLLDQEVAAAGEVLASS